METGGNQNERRRFSRVPFECRVRLSSTQGIWSGELVDISLKGVLIQVPPDWPGKVGQSFSVELRLAEDEASIKTASRVVHIQEQRTGFAWEHIDIDSFIHLKRLLQLNLADDAELMRELHELG